MKSVKEIYKIGVGPSSSHTMGPVYAITRFISGLTSTPDLIKVTLYGSLAKTGKGHGTDRALENATAIKTEIVFNEHEQNIEHPNTLDFHAYKNGEEIAFTRFYSIGGGDIAWLGENGIEYPTSKEYYKENSFTEIAKYCKENDIRLSDYVYMHEDEGFKDYLLKVWHTMTNAINEGLNAKGILPGGLKTQRKAKKLHSQRHIDESPQTRENRLVCSYAFAVSEQNADLGLIVTAPTCGSCGVLPAVLKYMQDKNGFTDNEIINALAVSGLIGNLVRTNASISGAECGCQAEVGTACSMAAAGLCELFGMTIDQIEYAAEMTIEHHLGLTCDPICGLVQIPCIERNAVASMRALNALSLANFLSDTRKISFDLIVKTMYQTGKDLNKNYRETSEGGLAVHYEV